jgi:hypothetical protein
MDKIGWFLNGISDDIKHVCQCDVKGKTWTDFESLREHALAEEAEERSRRRSLLKKVEIPFQLQKARFTQYKAKTNNKPSLAYAEAQHPHASRGPEAQRPGRTHRGRGKGSRKL